MIEYDAAFIATRCFTLAAKTHFVVRLNIQGLGEASTLAKSIKSEKLLTNARIKYKVRCN